MSLHYHYEQLTARERDFVDILMRRIFYDIKHMRKLRTFLPPVPLAGDDRAEMAADAIARWVIESRPPHSA